MAEAVTVGVDNNISNLANISAILFGNLGGVNWAGFYIAGEKDGAEQLLLGPFQGRPACTSIMRGRGVCGTAFSERRSIVVENVLEFPGHIACDERSRSEIVVPVFRDGAVYGVIDVDSAEYGRFGEDDREGLEALAALIGRTLV